MIPTIVYDVADGFQGSRARTARQIYNTMTNKIHFSAFQDTVLPKLVEAGAVSCRIAAEGTDHEAKFYKWIGLSNIDESKLEGITNMDGFTYGSNQRPKATKGGVDK